jgi:hypothetical protein
MTHAYKVYCYESWKTLPIMLDATDEVPEQYAVDTALLDAARDGKGEADIKSVGYTYVRQGTEQTIYVYVLYPKDEP